VQSGAKDKFYCTVVYFITLNSNCDVQRASKNFGENVKDEVKSQN
jgi:hypothetical protein